jgi:endonuclease/exonuclease/phosphatase family metal-dependent hydrolase
MSIAGSDHFMKDTPQLRHGTAWVWYGILSLFFFQLLSDFVAAVYAFGLLGTSIPPEIVVVLVLFAPIVLFFWRDGPGLRGQAALAILTLVAGWIEITLDTRGRMLVAGIGVGSFLVLLPSLLFDHGRRGEAVRAADIGIGASLGLALSICLRAWNSGVDPAPHMAYRVIEAGLVLIAGGLLLWRRRRQTARPINPIEAARLGVRATTGLALGLVAALTLLYFAFASPNVIARWTSSDYRLILFVILLALAAFVLAAGFIPRRVWHLPRGWLVLWNAAFVVALTATLLAHQIRFPADPGGYPFLAPSAPAWQSVSLLAMCALFPVILLDLGLYSRELIARRLSIRALGGAFSLASLFLLVMIFAQVFTTVYDYIPVIGPFFRDQFWAVFLVLGLVMMLPLLLIRRGTPAIELASPKMAAGVIALIGVTALAGALSRQAAAPIVPSAPTALRVLTYNIQQGYSADGRLNYLGQLALIQQTNADVIGLQETDTNRISGGNSDLVRYFADSLGYYSYYGPEVVPGTFGIALLSRYPIEHPRTFYMYSTGEQTAAIAAQITVGTQRFDVFVTHLGNGGPLVQQQAFLEEVGSHTSVVAMGDFNFRPDKEQYRLTRATLDDAWLVRWPQGVDNQGLNKRDQIDHIFLSPGTMVREARYLTTPDSDHPALLVEIGW